MMIIHGELVLVGDSDMELFVFVQELEELLAQNTLVAAPVGVDDEVLEVFDELPNTWHQRED